MNKTIIKDRVYNFKEEVSRCLFKKIWSFSPGVYNIFAGRGIRVC